MYMCVFVCVSTPRLLIISGVIWTPYDWLNKFYKCYMEIVAGIVNVRGLGIDTHRGNQINKSKLALYKVLIHCNIH